MKTIVLIKQVPMASAMTLDPETRTLRRQGVRLEVSSFDVRAVLKAIEMRDAGGGGEVVVLTMGPPQARSALEHCLALGADRGVHLSDRAFAGADTLATARALALAIEREGCDLVLCGRHSTDAETAQVGPEVAELAALPQVTAAAAISVDEDGRTLTVERETDAGFETVRCPLPALVSATEDLIKERFLRRDERDKGKEKPIRTLIASDLSDDPSIFGAAGSPTWVDSVETVAVERQQRILAGELSEQVDALVEILLDRGLYGTWNDEGSRAQTLPAPLAGADGKSVWVVAETLEGELRPVTLELLGKARQLACRHGGEVAAVLAGSGVEAHVATLAARGADAVYLADDARLADYTTDVHAAVLARAIETHRPGIVLLGSTANGRDLAPRVAARLGLGLTGDCIDLAVDDDGRLVQYKPAFGGNVVAPIYSRTVPEMATVRPGMLEPAPAVEGRQARLVPLELDDLPASRVEILSRTGSEAAAAAALDSAEIAVGIGKGLGGPENLALIEGLAAALGDAPLAATRPVADLGWLPRQFQVGLTGRSIAPRLYFAVALRGSLEHTVGIRRAGFVVAINDRDRSPIFKQADVGIVGDYAEVVPRLTTALIAARRSRQ